MKFALLMAVSVCVFHFTLAAKKLRVAQAQTVLQLQSEGLVAQEPQKPKAWCKVRSRLVQKRTYTRPRFLCSLSKNFHRPPPPNPYQLQLKTSKAYEDKGYKDDVDIDLYYKSLEVRAFSCALVR